MLDVISDNSDECLMKTRRNRRVLKGIGTAGSVIEKQLILIGTIE